MKAKVTVTRAGGDTYEYEFENDFTLAEAIEELGLSGKVVLNGEAVDGDAPVADGDVISEGKTAEGA